MSSGKQKKTNRKNQGQAQPAKKQNSKPVKPQNVKPQPSSKPAPRRRGRRGYPQQKQEKIQNKVERGAGFVATDNQRDQKALGDRSTIMVDVNVDAQAVQSFFYGLISVALSLGFKNTEDQPIYAAYSARLQDFVAILKSGTPIVPAHLYYELLISASYTPKTVPFKTGTISTSWKGTDSITPVPYTSLRGYTYSMYVPSPTISGVWQVFVAPPTVSLEDSIPILAKMYNYLSSNWSHALRYVNKIELLPDYSTDISGFGSSSAYYGEGCSKSGAPYKSVEWETPVKAPLLSCISQFNPSDRRVARKLMVTGGDSVFVGGVGLLPDFDCDFYQTKMNPIFCFLDLDEVVVWLIEWYKALIDQALKTSNPVDPQGQPFSPYVPFSYSAQQFRIAVRQAVLGVFVQSQAISQTLTYTDDTRGFEPLRVGTNCFSAIRDQMTMPLLLVENLRMLLPRRLAQQNAPLSRSRNQQFYIPVWGIYKTLDREPYNVLCNLYTEGFNEVPLFNENIAITDPGIIDGSVNGNWLNLNSAVVSDIIFEWNQRIAILQTFSAPTGYLGGSARASLLIFTRYCFYEEVAIPLKKLTRFQQHIVPRQDIKKKKIVRTNSNKDVKKLVEEEDYYIPNGASLYSQFTSAYSSLPAFTETSRQILNYFITPTIAIDENFEPTIRQVRTANFQSHIIEYDAVPASEGLLTARGLKLVELAQKCAPGIASAGKADELMSVIQAMSDMDQGGFFGSLASFIFPEFAPVLNSIPF
jgi:hypothetical protein